MCVFLVRVLQSVVSEYWNKNVICIATDATASMVGHVSGAVFKIERLCLSRLYSVWFGVHQLDLAVQKAFVTKV